MVSSKKLNIIIKSVFDPPQRAGSNWHWFNVIKTGRPAGTIIALSIVILQTVYPKWGKFFLNENLIILFKSSVGTNCL